jgi:hypothetical protein
MEQLLTKEWLVAREPECGLWVEQDRLSASHSTSIWGDDVAFDNHFILPYAERA